LRSGLRRKNGLSSGKIAGDMSTRHATRCEKRVAY
jgi:hypothetical protein